MPVNSFAALTAAGGLALSGGGSGLLSVPDAGMLAPNSFVYQHDSGVIAVTDPRAQSLERSETDQVQFAPARWLEFGARLTTWYDESSGRRNYNDLSGHFKLQLFRSDSVRVAVGARDFAGEATSLDPAYFAVADWRTERLRVALGFGAADDEGASLDGVFGGVAFQPFSWLTLMADHDAAESQVGFQLSHAIRRTTLFARAYYSSNDETEFAYAAGFQVNLNQDITPGQGSYVPATLSQDRVAWSDFVLFPWGADDVAGMYAGGQRDSGNSQANCARDVRYGAQQVPMLMLHCESGHYRVDWDSGLRASVRPRWMPLHAQVRLEPALRYAVGTEYGRFDYSLAARGSLQVHLPLGVSVYGVWDAPVDDSEEYDDRGNFRADRFRSGFYEGAATLTLHPLPGLALQGQLGQTRINDEHLDYSRLEAALSLARGRFAVHASATEFDITKFSPIAQRQVLGRVFAWLKPAEYAIQITAGDFQYDDSGTRVDLFRYIGRVRLGLYGKIGENDKAIGYAVSVPLTGRRAWQTRHLSIAGAPHFQPTLETQVDTDDGANPLRPNFMREFVPQRDLIDDVLDQWRMSPLYIENRSRQ